MNQPLTPDEKSYLQGLAQLVTAQKEEEAKKRGYPTSTSPEAWNRRTSGTFAAFALAVEQGHLLIPEEDE